MQEQVFQIGDRVCWTSSAGGYTKRKAGTVVAIVPAGRRPEAYVPEGCVCAYPLGFGANARSENSYLVREGTRSKKIRWPHTRWLARTEEKEACQ